MIRTLYEIVTYDEFMEMGYQVQGKGKGSIVLEYGGPKEVKEAAHKALLAYQIWQAGKLNEETQRPFEEAVENWRNSQ